MNPAFEKFLKLVVKASESPEKLRALLEPIHSDHLRLQHLDDVKNDILPFEDDQLQTCPKVDAAWLLRTANFNADLRTMIDDDMAYWAKQ